MVVAVISHRVVMRRSVRPRPRPCRPPAAVRGVNGDWSRHGDNQLLTTSHRDKAETSVNRDDTYLHHKKVDMYLCISCINIDSKYSILNFYRSYILNKLYIHQRKHDFITSIDLYFRLYQHCQQQQCVLIWILIYPMKIIELLYV